MQWKPDWPEARAALEAWWNGLGPAIAVFAPLPEPRDGLAAPPAAANLTTYWTDPTYRRQSAEWQMARTWYGGAAFPYLDTQIGPGSLGIILGSQPVFDAVTVWYRPCLDDGDDQPVELLTERNRWLDTHLALIDEGRAKADGRYLVGMPDLIEGLDTLAAMRGTERLLRDLVDRPDWVHRRLREIYSAYEATFDLMHDRLADGGGNAYAAFRIWGPGRTAKIQCDVACMLSPAMFAEFYVPYATAQCRYLDHSMYHLDGPGAMQHLDALLAIEPLDAIQWTPGPGQPNPGSPAWYDLFRRIKAGGKAVHVTGASPEQVPPLLDAIGPDGTFVLVYAPDVASGEALLEHVRRHY